MSMVGGFQRAAGVWSVVLLTGCSPRVDYHDQFSATASICPFEVDGEPLLTPSMRDPFFPSDACADAVLDDLNVDRATFAEVDGVPTSELVSGAVDLQGTRLGLVLGTARAFFVVDFGQWSDVQPNLLISDEFHDEMEAVHEATGVDSLGGLLYNFVTSVVERTYALDEEGGRLSFFSSSRSMVVRGPLTDEYAPGVVIVHEARHLWQSHVPCPYNPDRNCDKDAGGPFGFVLASVLLAYQHTDDEGAREYLAGRLYTAMRHICTIVQDDGELGAEYSDLDYDDL